VRAVVLLFLGACSFERGSLTNEDVPKDAPADVPDGMGSGSGSDGGDGGGGNPTSLRQKTITIGNGVVGTHTSFPLWVSLTDSDLAARASANGADIHFVAGGTDLDYQIQSWTKSNGRLDAWVRVPSLAAGTQIAIRYGDATAAHAQNAPATFTGYSAVWHLEDSLTTTTIVDARGTANGTASQLQTSDSITGKLGRGIDFDGGNNEITFANPLTGTTAHTVSLWVDQRMTNSNDALVVLGTGATNQSRWFHSRFNTATIAVGFYGNDFVNVDEDIIADGWVLLHWVYEAGINRRSRLYRDGVLVAGPFDHDPGINTTGSAGYLGNAPQAFGPNMGLNGTLDEVRIINVARSADWIAAEAANQSAPSTFYTVGPEQTP
jgi:hypothetical protein